MYCFSHNAQYHRQTYIQTDDIMMPLADHVILYYRLSGWNDEEYRNNRWLHWQCDAAAVHVGYRGRRSRASKYIGTWGFRRKNMFHVFKRLSHHHLTHSNVALKLTTLHRQFATTFSQSDCPAHLISFLKIYFYIFFHSALMPQYVVCPSVRL